MTWLAGHRCRRQWSHIQTHWRLGPDVSSIILQCVQCSDSQILTIRTPFYLFDHKAHEYMRTGWPELEWEGRLPRWQLRHQDHLSGGDRFVISRRLQRNRMALTIACHCGENGPSVAWDPEWTAPPTQGEEASVTLPTPQEPPVVDEPQDKHDRLFKKGDETVYVRNRRTGLIYRLPRLQVLLEYAGRKPMTPSQLHRTTPIEDLWDEWEPYTPIKEGPTWHDRILADDDLG